MTIDLKILYRYLSKWIKSSLDSLFPGKSSQPSAKGAKSRAEVAKEKAVVEIDYDDIPWID